MNPLVESVLPLRVSAKQNGQVVLGQAKDSVDATVLTSRHVEP